MSQHPGKEPSKEIQSQSLSMHEKAGLVTHQADVCVGEGLGGAVDLLQDQGWVGAAEHGQLPHCPVAVVIVALQGMEKNSTGTCNPEHDHLRDLACYIDVFHPADCSGVLHPQQQEDPELQQAQLCCADEALLSPAATPCTALM